MEIVRLPQQLPDSSALAAFNQRLHNADIHLDWSQVVADNLRLTDLEILFAGLNLSEHVELIGGESIPDALMPAILAAFATIAVAQQELADAEPTTADIPDTVARPGIWLPEAEMQPDPHEEETQDEPASSATPVAPLLKAPTPAELRDELESMVIRDLLGPAGGEDEELDEDRVRDRYLVGLIAPNEAQIPAEELDSMGSNEEGAEDHGPTDSDASQTTSLSPSSIGMSFCVDLQAREIHVTARWGHYQRTDSQGLTGKKGEPKKVWRRIQRGGDPRRVFLKEGSLDAWEPEPEEQPNVFVKGLIRRSSDCWTVTLFLVNGQSLPKQLRDSAWLFQPELHVAAPQGRPIFQRRPSALQRLYKEEDKALAMLYRQHVSFAVGHGVSIHAETLPGDPTTAVRLSTRVIPSYEVPHTEAPTADEIPALTTLCLDMQLLAEAASSDLPDMLQPLPSAYDAWITAQEQRLLDLDPTEDLSTYRNTAKTALQQCRNTLGRIRAGIALLVEDPHAAHAFAFMNRAMWQQRIHALHIEARRSNGTQTLQEIDKPVNRSWRPFQLAFILLNLPALTDLHHPERSSDPSAIADLLWFPTGGGKTEAYLGLTAYTLAIRRLQGTVAGRTGMEGVAVIMRYTLRLLTLQQFQRAAALICACEVIRRADSATWGQTPFRLGLWVGQRSTPNTTDDCVEALQGFRETRGIYTGGLGNPRQLTNCPWCGSDIDAGKDIIAETYAKGRGRTFTYCSDPFGQCPFSRAQSSNEGLPILVVDEEIYRLLPALLIATVDKFAQLPWKGQTQMLFGQVDKYCERHGFSSSETRDSDSHKAQGRLKPVRSVEHGPLRPPDLIIQDELHLISGPLGTLVGLYETAVDALATWEVAGRRVRPKVIAATATIRQARQQIQALFMRQANIFPPQGLDIDDNFFARQRQSSPTSPGRRYLGISANGRRMKAAQIRVYLAYLASAQALCDKYGEAAADPWLTLVGYFNSMSDLGSMRHMVDDDISNRIRKMDQRGLGKRRSLKVSELTSRIDSSNIPTVLNNLEQSFGVKGARAIDVLLATNMISVGVDVKRLSLMVVAGQPKTTAEYIQATSRVGRTFPGLVCIVYNWTRPRDISHYEQFEHYHASFYQQVEALSVTPFAPRALDRGLAALLTSFVRLSGQQFNRNNTAGKLNTEALILEQAITAIIQRAEEVANPEASEHVRADLQKLKAHWLNKASSYANLGYEEEKKDDTVALLKRPKRGKWEPFTCLNSLRNVEPNVHLLLENRDLGRPYTQTTEETQQEEEE